MTENIIQIISFGNDVYEDAFDFEPSSFSTRQVRHEHSTVRRGARPRSTATTTDRCAPWAEDGKTDSASDVIVGFPARSFVFCFRTSPRDRRRRRRARVPRRRYDITRRVVNHRSRASHTMAGDRYFYTMRVASWLADR